MAYLTQHTWLEQGPAIAKALQIPVPSASSIRRRAGAGAIAGRGMGAIPQLSTSYCESYWSLANPLAWFGGCAKSDVASIYEKVEYGHIPRAGELPQAPVPGVVASGELPAITAADWANYTQAQRDALQAAQDNGSWNPEGNLPMNATEFERFWKDYGTWVLFGGVCLAGVVAWKVAVR